MACIECAVETGQPVVPFIIHMAMWCWSTFAKEAMQHAEGWLHLEGMHEFCKADGQDAGLWWLASITSQC